MEDKQTISTVFRATVPMGTSILVDPEGLRDILQGLLAKVIANQGNHLGIDVAEMTWSEGGWQYQIVAHVQAQGLSFRIVSTNAELRREIATQQKIVSLGKGIVTEIEKTLGQLLGWARLAISICQARYTL